MKWSFFAYSYVLANPAAGNTRTIIQYKVLTTDIGQIKGHTCTLYSSVCKEYILVTERTAHPCVFQTFAHPTSPDYLTEQSPHP